MGPAGGATSPFFFDYLSFGATETHSRERQIVSWEKRPPAGVACPILLKVVLPTLLHFTRLSFFRLSFIGATETYCTPVQPGLWEKRQGVSSPIRRLPQHYLSYGTFSKRVVLANSAKRATIMSFENVGPYPLSSWTNDRLAQKAHRLSCLVCHQDANYQAYHEAVEGRRYRFCKECGFYQDVDGDPIQMVLTEHQCIDLPDGEHCDRCHKWGPREQHACLKAVRRAEFGTDVAKCDECGKSVSEQDEIQWSVSAL